MKQQSQSKEKCPCVPIEISKDREIVETDNIQFPWSMDTNGYFLVKIVEGKICVGFVKSINDQHKMVLELRGKNPDKIIKEIAKRNICNLANMGYIASELMIAKDCLDKGTKYIQR
ncbi:MAG: hypothetical protein ACE5ES_04865 [Candidatus Nanoarchaeia archaeon]